MKSTIAALAALCCLVFLLFDTLRSRASAQDCCDCAPTASDQQCFMQCNAMIPRCRPAAPRQALPAQAAPGGGQAAPRCTTRLVYLYPHREGTGPVARTFCNGVMMGIP
jgi:hypothetical protein